MQLFDDVLSQPPTPPIDQHTASPVRDVVSRMHSMVELYEEDFARGTVLKQHTGDATTRTNELMTLSYEYRASTSATQRSAIYSLELLSLRAKSIYDAELRRTAFQEILRDVTKRLLPSRFYTIFSPQEQLAFDYRAFAKGLLPDIQARVGMCRKVAKKLEDLRDDLKAILQDLRRESSMPADQ